MREKKRSVQRLRGSITPAAKKAGLLFLFLLLFFAADAKAGVVKVTFDPSDDALAGSRYDIRGMAVLTEGNKTYILIASNMPDPLNGNPGHESLNSPHKFIARGDILINLNCANETLFDSSKNNHLYGIRFDPENESGVQGLGVYKDVMAKSVALNNYGPKDLAQYLNLAPSAKEGDFSKKEMITLRGLQNKPLNMIDKGMKIGDVKVLSAAQLPNFEGFNLDSFKGKHNVFGVEFNTSLLNLESTSWCAHYAMECFNDSIGQEHIIPEIPQNFALVSLFMVLMTGTILFLRQRLQYRGLDGNLNSEAMKA